MPLPQLPPPLPPPLLRPLLERKGRGEGKEGGDASAPWKEERERGDGGRMKPPRPAACPDTLAGASAALGAYAAMVGNPDVVVGDGGSPRGGVSAREALLGVLGKLYQQCSVYLAPCQGDPLLERMMPPPPRGARTEARVQLQLIRREERALKAVVQPEVCRKFCIVCVLFCFFHLGECLLLERKSCVSFVGDSSSAPPSPPPPHGRTIDLFMLSLCGSCPPTSWPLLDRKIGIRRMHPRQVDPVCVCDIWGCSTRSYTHTGIYAHAHTRSHPHARLPAHGAPFDRIPLTTLCSVVISGAHLPAPPEHSLAAGGHRGGP